MTIFVPFTPTSTSVFQFQATYDGNPYLNQIKWSIAGRWYLYITDQANNQILTRALTSGSPDDYDFNILDGVFVTSTLVFRESTQNFEVGP